MSGERDENGAKINAHRICETENEPLFLLYVFVLLLLSHTQLVSHFLFFVQSNGFYGMRSAMGRSAQMQSRHTAFHDPFRAADPFRTLDPFRGHDPFSQGMSFHAQHNLGSDSYNQFVEAQMQVTYTTIAVIFSHAVFYHLL